MSRMQDFIRKNHLVLTLCVIFMAVIAVQFFLLDRYIKETTIDTNKKILEVMADEKASKVDMFLRLQEENLLVLSSLDEFREVLLTPDDALKREKAEKKIDELAGIFPGISVLDTDGVVIVGEIDVPGTDYSGHPAAESILKGSKPLFVPYYDPLRKKDYYAVVGPIYDGPEKKNVIGVISFDVDLHEISSLMDGALKDQANEVYLIDKDGLLLSSSEYLKKDEKQGVLVQEVKSVGAQECLGDLKRYAQAEEIGEHEEEVPTYLNYMGDEVLGAHAYVTSLTGCVIAEIRTDEIRRSSLRRFISMVFLKER